MKKNLMLLSLLLPVLLAAQSVIRIGATVNQPPYSFEKEGGLVFDILNELNKVQKEYTFVLDLLPPERARQYFKEGKVGGLAMTNIAWGYDQTMCKATKDLIKVQDKYFARKDVAKNQDYFKRIGIDPTIVVNGFNYTFLNFTTDQTILKSKYNTTTTSDEPNVIKMILNKRGNVGVSSSTTLGYFSITNPSEFKELLLSDISDSEYYRYFLFRNDSEITVTQFNSYMDIIEKNGTLKKILAKYGL